MPDLAVPVVTNTLPDVPLRVDPVPMYTVPLTPPAEAVPVGGWKWLCLWVRRDHIHI